MVIESAELLPTKDSRPVIHGREFQFEYSYFGNKLTLIVFKLNVPIHRKKILKP